MGGFGSGNRFRWNRKTTVEECLTLSISDCQPLEWRKQGSLTWSRGTRREASIGYHIEYDAEGPIIVLQFSFRDEPYRIPVRIQSTQTHFNGRRSWFTCPMAVARARGQCQERGNEGHLSANVPVARARGRGECQRRVGKLYSPPNSPYFGCRVCHDLTYRSCQESHQRERALAAWRGAARRDLESIGFDEQGYLDLAVWDLGLGYDNLDQWI